MSEMVERVARAVGEAQVGVLNSWEHTPEWRRDVLRRDARAAIAAMREPTEAMCSAAWSGSFETDDMWRAMIDAALKET